MSNSRLFCIGFVIWATGFAVSFDFGGLTTLAMGDYWTGKLVTAAMGGCLMVAILGDRWWRKRTPTPDAKELE